jgi:ferric-dicitrate binding protein FerR (iron transport regulator)
VQLEGEAYFDVVPDRRRFVVTTSDAEIEVLGTRFNIRSWAGDTEVSVESGRVRVKTRVDASREVMLAGAGEAVRIQDDSLLIRHPAMLDYVLAWRRRAFAAIDRPLGTILQDVERLYGLSVEVGHGVALQDSMTLLYGPDTAPESILHDICLARNCRYRRTSRGFALFSTP